MRVLYAGMENELLVLTHSGEGWRMQAKLKGTQPVRVAVDPSNASIVYCATYGHGLWKSEDAGESWQAIGKPQLYFEPAGDHGIPSPYITFVGTNPVKKGEESHVVYAGTEPSAMYYSEDGGRHWQEWTGIQHMTSRSEWQFPPRPHTHHVRWITPGYGNPDHIAVSIEYGAVLLSEDHGSTWQDRPEHSPRDVHTLLAHPSAPGRLYAACGDGFMNASFSYAESEDDGWHWHYQSEGLEKHPYLYNMVLNATDADDRFVSAARGPREAHSSDAASSAIYRKEGEAPFREISRGLPAGSFAHVLAQDPEDTDIFYALNNHGIFFLRTDEEIWQPLNIAWKDAYKQQHPSCFTAGSL
ncbi:sialidase family protein [Marinococcus sp. PL1-022]|uniref:WD40/YVTN/BNR-like repeat-containing protein n=1 Tax=Marinococcus sp. PL1-022 TaxID=3095363 RepID=UPI0029C38163|nr:sialidase family protein [Marinococcus sp. PL1-022]MDX6152586.1 sialidase family protein [Marinococcus sp. PL1-022]